MKKIIVIVLLMMSSAVLADGQKLHGSSCMQCHSSLMGGDANSIYARPSSKIKNLAGLQKRVTACATAADANWTSEQKNQVVQYLANTFYTF